MSATKHATIVKARLRNFGNGVLEVSNDTVKFYVESGRLRKSRETVRGIPIAEIESLERNENDLSITWKGSTDVFALDEKTQADGIQERIAALLKEHQKSAENKAARDQKETEQKQVEQNSRLVQAMTNAVKVASSLFDVLRHLHGRIDWKLVEFSFKQVDEAAEKFASENMEMDFLDVKPLSVAVQQRYPKEIADRALEALKTLYEHFRPEEASPVDSVKQLHPNPHDAKLMLRAFYVLNDMMLGAIVGDKDLEKESAELLKLLEEMAKQPGSQIDLGKVKSSFEKLSAGKEKQKEGFEEIRVMLELQLKDLSSLATRSLQASPVMI